MVPAQVIASRVKKAIAAEAAADGHAADIGSDTSVDPLGSNASCDRIGFYERRRSEQHADLTRYCRDA